MANEYQGFTGSNYEEDDRERAKHGGFVKFFGNSENQVTPQQMVLKAISENPSSVITKEYDKAKEYNKLDDVRSNIMNIQHKLDEMLGDAMQKYPGVRSDIENNRQDHFEEFLSAYPEYEKLQNQQEELQKQYQGSPFHFEHLTNRTKDSDLKTGLRESEIFKLLKPNGV